MPVDSEQDKKKKESSSPNVTFLCEYSYDLFIVVCVYEIFLKRRLFSAPCVAALVLSDGEQQWGFGQPAFVCFDLNWTREFGSVWRQSVGLFSAWSDWAAIEWHNCLPAPDGGLLAFCSCQTGSLLRRLAGNVSLQSSSTSQISCCLPKIRIITAALSGHRLSLLFT